MELNMKETGKMICNMDTVLKHGQMDQGMKVTIRMEKNMEWGPTHGVMVLNMWAIGMIIK